MAREADVEMRADHLFALGEALRAAGYSFVTPTPATHQRVNERARSRAARDLRDVFGWSRSFVAGSLPPEIAALATRAGVLIEEGDRLRATVRFSTIGPRLFVHSAYPTTDPDAVFFGPDTYRYCRFIAANVPRGAKRVVDIGCGSGAGGIVASDHVARVVLADVNRSALMFAAVSARFAGLESRVQVIESDVLEGVDGPIDVAMANPPYLVDPGKRTYRDGGGSFGEGLAVRMATEALERLDRGGRLVLYTGATIVDGVDTFLTAVRPVCEARGTTWRYEELDPDVFGEEIQENDSYAVAERIAAVGLVVDV